MPFRTFRVLLLGLLLFGLLPGCQPPADEACVLIQSDFEQFEGWFDPLPGFLNTEQAHSGRYSYRLGNGAEYGSVYRTTLANTRCEGVPRRLRLSAWVYLPSGRIRKTKLVVQVDCHGRRPNVWRALEVSEVVRRYQQWERVQKNIALPTDLDPSDELQFYVWHAEANGEPTWVDDLLVEGWQ